MAIQNGPNGSQHTSSYMQYLPAIYRDDEFMGQYLNIFEDIMRPIENTVGNLAMYFDPLLSPEVWMPWLAGWLNLVLNPSWPMKKRRELVKYASLLYRWRGTKRGLSEYLRIYTGGVPEIIEYVPGMRLDSDTRLGVNTQLGSAGTGHHFTVTVEIDSNNEVNIDTVKSIIDDQKPAHTVYTLQVRRRE
ncbi:phage tail protein [Chloroflexota bacterium]